MVKNVPIVKNVWRSARPFFWSGSRCSEMKKNASSPLHLGRWLGDVGDWHPFLVTSFSRRYLTNFFSGILSFDESLWFFESFVCLYITRLISRLIDSIYSGRSNRNRCTLYFHWFLYAWTLLLMPLKIYFNNCNNTTLIIYTIPLNNHCWICFMLLWQISLFILSLKSHAYRY